MANESSLVPALVFAEVAGVGGEVYADELSALAGAGVLLPTTILRPDGGEPIKASGLVLEFPKKLTDAHVTRLLELKSSPRRKPETKCYSLPPSYKRAERIKTALWLAGFASVPLYFFGGPAYVGAVVLCAIGVVCALEAVQLRRHKIECREIDENNRPLLEAWYRDVRLAELAGQSLASLTRSEAKRVMEALQIGCREAVSDCKRAFSNEQCVQFGLTTWLRSCITDDGQLAVCRWDTGLAIINDVDAEGSIVSIQHSGLRQVSKWFCDYERAQSGGDSEALEELKDSIREAIGVNSEELPGVFKLAERSDPGGLQRALGFRGHQWPSKQLLPLWLDLKPGMKWEDIISFRKGNVELSRPKSRGPVLKIGLEDLASVREDHKLLLRAAIDGIVEARLPELVSSFKRQVFQAIDEISDSPTRQAADSANLKVLAAKVARADDKVQALFAKLMTDHEFGDFFAMEVKNLRAERELKALEVKLAADAEHKEREVRAFEAKLAEDAKLERDRLSAEIDLRKEHLALESKKQSELLEQLRRQADAAEDAVTMARHQLYAMQEQTDATESAGRRVAKEIEKQERKNRGEWSILDEWFGG